MQIKEEMKKKSRKCCSKSCQYQITNCITRSLLHSRSLQPSIIQMILSAKSLEDWCPKHFFFFFTNSFSWSCSDTADGHQHCKGRDVPPFFLSVLQVSRDPQGRGTGLCTSHRSLLQDPRYHHGTLAKQPPSPLRLLLRLLGTRPFTLPGCKLPTVKWA